jgi:hypothetical protein
MSTLLYAPPPSCRDRLSAMSPKERLAAYRSGALSLPELDCWGSLFPEEVPMVNDEFPWIVGTLADLE